MPTNTAPMVLPQYQGNYYELQNRQALAQALMGAAIQNQASQIPTNMPVMPKFSIGAGLSQLGQAYLAAKLQQSAAQGLGDLGAAQMGYLAGGAPAPGAAAQGSQTGSVSNPFAGDQGGAAPAGASGAPPVAAPSGGGLLAPGSALNPSGMDPSKAAWLYYSLGPEKYSEQFVAPYVKPTDATLMANAAGVDPRAANADALFHANYVTPNQGTPGTIARNPRTNAPMYYSPEIPKGGEPVFDAGGNVVGMKGIDGALALIRNARAADEIGAGLAIPAQPQYDVQGNPLPTMSRTQSISGGGMGGAAPTLSQIFAQQESSGGKTAPDNPMQIQQGTFKQYAQPGESWDRPGDRTTVANRVLAGYQQKYGGDLGRIATAYFSGEGNVAPAGSPTPFIKNVSDSNGKSVASYVGDIYGRAGASAPAGGGNYPVQPPGIIANANAAAAAQQGELSKRWTDLVAQNQQAQGVISNLQNIKSLAAKAAVGPQSDRLNYVNGLLSLAGSEKATDTVTANNLLDKYSNQITARLSAGGMSTDSARAILQSAYPNSHMTPQAINEAADNLVGASQMVQAKANLLAPYRNKNDATGYTNAELQFDQAADPRIFQYANIKDPAARKAFAQNLAQQDPGIVQKIQTLQQLGALK